MDADEELPVPTRYHFSETEKWAVVAKYLFHCDPVSGRLQPRALVELAERFGMSKSQIKRFVREYKEQDEQGRLFPSLASKNSITKGPLSDLTEETQHCIMEFNDMEGDVLPLREFTHRFNTTTGSTFRKSAMHKYLAIMKPKTSTEYIKPSLTVGQKRTRLQWILDRVEPDGNGEFQFESLNHVVHVDEKWFDVELKTKKRRVFEGSSKKVVKTAGI